MNQVSYKCCNKDRLNFLQLNDLENRIPNTKDSQNLIYNAADVCNRKLKYSYK